MTIRNLEYLFAPASIAVIGASERPGSVGAAVTRNLLSGGFGGTLGLVNPRHTRVAGRPCVADVSRLDFTPHLAVVATPPASVPGVIEQLGAKGIKAAVVLTAGLGEGVDAAGRPLVKAMLEAARPHLLRILGPNCVGLLSPRIGVNASFAHAPAHPGNVAFVSQSGALTTALLDWARRRGIGFSHFVSLGESADVDFGDTIDYLATDPATRAILLYAESIKHARKFMSAARAAARNKPIIVVKAGRAPEGARAAASHTGALAGADDVYDAAFRRAGLLRVTTTTDLFVAAETLARTRPLAGDRPVIFSNGGGPAVMAADALSMSGGTLATLGDETLAALSEVLPATWSRGNPVDIIGDAPPARYADGLRIVLADDGVDAVLFIHAPTAIADSTAVAQACLPLLAGTRKPVFSCWLGGDAVAQARELFTQAGLPTYDTPEEAVSAFLQVAQFRRNQELLLQTPPGLPTAFSPDKAAVRAVVEGALASGRSALSAMETNLVLSAYGVDTVPLRTVRDVGEAIQAASELGFPVALKIHSPDISHKSDVGGVALNLDSAEMLRDAATAMLERARRLRPAATQLGFLVQRMVQPSGAHELIVGASTDPVFGPVILFGQGGTAVEVVPDKAVALPPLDAVLARDLVSRTRVARLLAGYRDRPPVDRDALDRTLVRVAQLVTDIPEVVEMDINPLLADRNGAVSLDARMSVAPATVPGAARLAIRPYPNEWEQTLDIRGRTVILRPIRPEDEPAFKNFIGRLELGDVYFRFFHFMRELPHSQLARFTQIDYDREIALVAVCHGELVADVRAVADPDNVRAEFAIVVRSDWTGKGLGFALMSKLIGYCRQRGTAELYGEVLATNRRMLDLASALGFRATPVQEGLIRVTLDLAAEPQAPAAVARPGAAV